MKRMWLAWILILAALLFTGCSLFGSGGEKTAASPAPSTGAQTGATSTATAGTSGQPASTAGPGGNGGSGGSGAVPVAPAEEPVIPSAAVSVPLQGLYAARGTFVRGDAGAVQMVSKQSCSELVEMVSAGQWRAAQRVDFPKLPGSKYDRIWVVLERGDRKALLTASGQGYCEAAVTLLEKLPIQIQGGMKVNGTTTMYPYTCMENPDLTVSTIGILEGPGKFFGSVQLTVPPTPGTYPISDDNDVSLTVGEMEESFFAMMAKQLAQATTGQQGGDSDKAPEPKGFSRDLGLQPGVGTGQVVVTSQKPFRGRIVMKGAQDEEGRKYNLEIGFACNKVQSANVDLASVKQYDSLTLAVELKSKQKIEIGSIPSQGQTVVKLQGTLKPVTPVRYEGSMSATGSGSFSEPDYSGDMLSGPTKCAQTWTGTAKYHVVGTVSGKELTLRFTKESVSLKLKKPCNADNYKDPSELPYSPSALGGTLKLKWPPEAANKRQQGKEDLLGMGEDRWTVEFK